MSNRCSYASSAEPVEVRRIFTPEEVRILCELAQKDKIIMETKKIGDPTFDKALKKRAWIKLTKKFNLVSSRTRTPTQLRNKWGKLIRENDTNNFFVRTRGSANPNAVNNNSVSSATATTTATANTVKNNNLKYLKPQVRIEDNETSSNSQISKDSTAEKKARYLDLQKKKFKKEVDHQNDLHQLQLKYIKEKYENEIRRQEEEHALAIQKIEQKYQNYI